MKKELNYIEQKLPELLWKPYSEIIYIRTLEILIEFNRI